MSKSTAVNKPSMADVKSFIVACESQVKILLFDIETTPNLAYIWGKYQQDAVGFSDHSHLLSFSAKWLNEDQITLGLIDYPLYDRDKHSDKALIKDIWALFDASDIVVAHNGRAFDTKKVNARFSFYDMNPPSPYKIVDTKEMSKRYFNFTSNSLDDISQYLGIGKKMPTAGFDLWLRCMAGEPEAWATMKSYNAYDVTLLERVYLRMLPYADLHPNMSTILEGTVCPKCGSSKLQARGIAKTQSTIYQRFQCQACGGWSRSVKKQSPIRGVIKNIG